MTSPSDTERKREPQTLGAGHIVRNLEAFTEAVADEDEQLRWQGEKLRLIESVLDGVDAHGVLADVGCFTGAATARYAAHGFERAVGFDLSAAALAVARGRGIETRLWRAGEEPCPAADGEFDIVIAADIIEHIVDTDAFLTEIRRIVRSDGLVIITTPNLAFWISRLRMLLGRTPWSYPGPSPTVKADLTIDVNHIRVSTRKEWENLFISHRFRVQAVRGWSILHAMGSSLGIRIRRMVDRCLTRNPDFSFGLLFVLRKPQALGPDAPAQSP
jgi:2-polyprenyl-3-methyl-5-hydroxy-6-metoxy-1,4-benzoquinol methylase